MHNDVRKIGEEAVMAYFKAHSDNCLDRLKNSMKQPQSRHQLGMIGYCHYTDIFTRQERTLSIHWIQGPVDLQHLSEYDNKNIPELSFHTSDKYSA
jgi:hypothetical protein